MDSLRTLLLLSLLLFAAYSTQIDLRTIDNSYILPEYVELEFSNYTGRCVSFQEIVGFQNIVNDAYIYYGTNTNANLQYIVKNMNLRYALPNEQFVLHLQKIDLQDEDIDAEWSMQSTKNCSVAAFKGVNKYLTIYSYLLSKTTVPQRLPYMYTSSIGKGIGVDGTLERVIVNIISALEPTESQNCDCRGTDQIGSRMRDFTGQSWNVVCDQWTLYNYFMSTTSNRWITLRPLSCLYVMYQTQ